ncbi:MAG: glycoside hydrolase family 31 protein [Cytophagales bacterium]|nr:glycoside hydrolase family 31 protein [Cytophagales bacterium]MDW8384096.1 glycoside hydrolase family 31 protein [Flammeovirgaceae bacterium]
MKKSAVLLLVCLSHWLFAQNYNPKANEKAIVRLGNARFTILTPRTVRMEWSQDGKFEDRATFTFVNRNTPVPNFQVIYNKEKSVTIITDVLTLKYENTGKFNEKNLSIAFKTGKMVNKKPEIITWNLATKNKGNLLGTARTLDGCDSATFFNWRKDHRKEPLELEPGIISRDGWVLIDDSERPVFDNSDWPWVEPRPETDKQDYYFFAYGNNYKQALADYTLVAGKIALPPKYVFGVWWSRFWAYTDKEFKELVEEFETYGIPLDVLVIDTDWHPVNKKEWFEDGKRKTDAAGEPCGWTGFSWNRNHFPNSKEFLRWTDEKQLKTCLNLHPASGILPHEDQFVAMAQAMGLNPDTTSHIPFDITNKKFAENYMNIVLRPLEREGIDFWWLDWQQWNTTNIKGVNPTMYLNYVHYTDMQRTSNARPLIFHRWGGLGNHRYQIGFSGDTYITWRSLQFQPYFTATAANVCFGFWSHDIGGHMAHIQLPEPIDVQPTNPELFTRWVQWGAFSPIFRTHCSNAWNTERRIWAYPYPYFKAMKKAIKLRYALLPYIYTAARRAHDTGVSIVYPMYYDFPEDENAYQYKEQYLFGPDMLVAPIMRPMGGDSIVHPNPKVGTFWQPREHIAHSVYLPEGEWIDWNSGEKIVGKKLITRLYGLDEIPVFVRAGSIIPMQPEMKKVDEISLNPLILTIFQGNQGKTSIYEDEGNNQLYLEGKFTFTNVEWKRNGKTFTVEVAPIIGSYSNMPSRRSYQIRLPFTLPLQSVSVNGQTIPYRPEVEAYSWTYNGDETMNIITTQEIPVTQKVIIQIQFDVDTMYIPLLARQIKAMARLYDARRYYFWNEWEYESDRIVYAMQTGNRISYNPSKAQEEIRSFYEIYKEVLPLAERRAQEEPRSFTVALRWLKALNEISEK